jgi:hypothetical protein
MDAPHHADTANDLTGRVALVTGGAVGIGRAAVLALARAAWPSAAERGETRPGCRHDGRSRTVRSHRIPAIGCAGPFFRLQKTPAPREDEQMMKDPFRREGGFVRRPPGGR